MSSFTKPLVLKVLENGTKYELMEEFEYYLEEDKEYKITIPKGFITDLASVPRILYTLIPPFGRYSKSCVLHDYLCCLFFQNKITRKRADYIFKESMQAVGVKKRYIYTLYFGVRLWAFLHFYE